MSGRSALMYVVILATMFPVERDEPVDVVEEGELSGVMPWSESAALQLPRANPREERPLNLLYSCPGSPKFLPFVIEATMISCFFFAGGEVMHHVGAVEFQVVRVGFVK